MNKETEALTRFEHVQDKTGNTWQNLDSIPRSIPLRNQAFCHCHRALQTVHQNPKAGLGVWLSDKPSA